VRIAIAYFIIEKRKLRHSLGRPSRSDFVQFQFVELNNFYSLSGTILFFSAEILKKSIDLHGTS
ncbi:hypothetical protein, partial [Blautia sp. HCP3S3_C4]|uniref:hypothetical protein n=1 Tax=Blautia sp. HCP3S3_C4 TaxID=3438911 RepID=UPI003F8BAC58